jgi:hypothetical protein
MCQDCATIHPALAPQVRTMARVGLLDLIKRIERVLQDADRIEDRYREDGINYAMTQQTARDFCAGPALTRCKEAFGLTLPSQYEKLFAPLTNLVHRLSSLRSQAQHVPSGATAAHLLHVLSHELLPAMDALIIEFQTFEQRFTQLTADVAALVDVSCQSFETDESGARIAWSDFVGADEADRTLRSTTAGEWQSSRAWVRTLPETQRSLARAYNAESELDRIALDLLAIECDEFEN